MAKIRWCISHEAAVREGRSICDISYQEAVQHVDCSIRNAWATPVNPGRTLWDCINDVISRPKTPYV